MAPKPDFQNIGRRTVLRMGVGASFSWLAICDASTSAQTLNSASWLDWMTPRERDLFLNVDETDAPDLTRAFQAALDSGAVVIRSPGKGVARISQLVIPEAPFGRTLDLTGITLVQSQPLMGVGLHAGMMRQRFAAGLRFGGFDDLRIIGGHFVQTSEVHDAVFKLLYSRRTRLEGTMVTLRNGHWTPVSASYSSNRLFGEHSFRDDDYIALFQNAPSAVLPVPQRPYRVRDARPGSFALSTLQRVPIKLSAAGRGPLVAAYFGAWAFKIGGDDSVYDGLTVRGTDTVVYQDGIHVVHGRGGQVRNADVMSGDDAFALGQEIVHADCLDREIRDWQIEGVGKSRMGHLARLYTTSPTQSVSGIDMRLRGQAGLLRNGVVGVEGVPAIVPTVSKISINLTATTGLTEHSGINPDVIDVEFARDINISGQITGLGSPLLRPGDINLVNHSDLKIRI